MAQTLLITGVGALIGYGMIESARRCERSLRVVGIDIYEDAAGRNWCDEFQRAVPTASDEYPDFLKQVVERFGVDLVLPGIEQDANILACKPEAFAGLTAKLAVNNKELVLVSADKWLTYRRLRELGLPTIETRIAGSYRELCEGLGSPFLMKPRRSYASKGIQRIEDEYDLQYWRRKLGENFMAQQIVGSDDAEYTVGLFGYGDGTCSHILAMQRTLAADGSTAKARVVFLKELEELVRRVAEAFRPNGPTNIQFRLHEGGFLLLEINPRFSSTHSLRRAFGYNDVGACVEYYLEGRRPSEGMPRGGRAVRYMADQIVFDEESPRSR